MVFLKHFFLVLLTSEQTVWPFLSGLQFLWLLIISCLLVYSDFKSERHSWSFMNMIHVHRTFKTQNKGIFEGRFHCYIYASLKMSH